MSPDSFLTFVIARLPQLGVRTGEHLLLTGFSTGLAILLGVPLGLLAARIGHLRAPLLGATGILQTVPSLAMLAILLALTGKIGLIPAIIALLLYALLPIVRNTLAGIEEVPSPTIEAARGIGMRAREQLWLVKVPLALPVMVAGIRTAAVAGVGIATLSAFIGAGGLGQFINRGLALANNHLILLGAVPSALLALVVDLSIGAVLWALQPRRQRRLGPGLRTFLRMAAFTLPFLIGAAGAAAYVAGSEAAFTTDRGRSGKVIVGTKNFTEQIILGEMMAQVIERRTDLEVVRRFDLGGTMICHGALMKGEIDLYAEYTGTALTAILGEAVERHPDQVYDIVSYAYENRFGLVWLQPFGFNNTYAITVREADAEQKGWKKITDLRPFAANLRAGFTSEFAERPDGYAGLRDVYGVTFGEVRDLDPTLMYEALARREVDVICAFSTDGRIAAYHFKPLKDDLAFFPPYQAAPVVRKETLEKFPQLADVLGALAGALDDQTMRTLNFRVDEQKHSPKKVARDLLASLRLWKRNGQ
jgi:osmoprotectant transport system permease protein